eukprot:CAMPEP_0180347706 /NCGR_PEP_ID=MMETSP0989-20121125/4539_1 /TAXON_ID=697907 /ORGANISM="non described non described, Strain CCMP2293" /LENGTH=93 /DNA_ID=CAMNT_0022336901 /DNA_START=44 /DNA_END=325 /DNA_ORIENTATION=-
MVRARSCTSSLAVSPVRPRVPPTFGKPSLSSRIFRAESTDLVLTRCLLGSAVIARSRIDDSKSRVFETVIRLSACATANASTIEATPSRLRVS